MNRYQFEVIRNSVEKMLDQGATKRVLAIILKLHEADLAQLVELLIPPQRKKLFSLLATSDVTLASKVVSELENEVAVELFRGMSVDHINKILQEMSSDDAADIVSELPEELQQKIMETLRSKDSQDIQELLQYP
ncbi:MAG: hypothetical protein JW737_10155, partial [Acidobacteria bacterium]|nr:hypothetical protein [Acidobacteriota bacterium]